MKKRTLAALLAVLTLLGLAACGEKEESRPEEGTGSRPSLASGAVYLPEEAGWSSDLNMLYHGCVSGDWIFLSGRARGERGDEDALRRLPLEGGEAEPLPAYQPLAFPEEKQPPFLSIQDIRPGAEGTVWVWEAYRSLSAVDDPLYVLRQLDGEGRELFCLADRDLLRKLESRQLFGLLADGAGDICAATEKGVSVLSPQGEPRFTLELEGVRDGTQKLVRLGDGRVGVTVEARDPAGNDSFSLRVIDKDKRDWGQSYPLPANSYVPVYDGSGDALFFYGSGDSLCLWREGAQEMEVLLKWMDTGINGDTLRLLAPLAGGRLAVMTRGKDPFSAGGAALYTLSPADAGSLPEKKVLTYATMQLLGSEKSAILAFNNASPDYRIEVTDYSIYNTAEDRTAGITRLVTEISAGKVPDILNVSTLGAEGWQARGLFEDLWPYIDSDPELGREELMEGVFQALETGGKLYQIGGSFRIWTLTGAKSVVGDRMAWTPEDLWGALAAMPEGCIPLRENTKAGVLSNLLYSSGDRFVDWEEGVCRFDGPEFRSLLAFCGSFPGGAGTSDVNDEITRLCGGQQMLCSWQLTNFQSIQEMKYLLGGEVSFVGWPNGWGEVGSAFLLTESYAMSSACQDKAGAWSFLRTLLLPHADLRVDGLTEFPTNRADFARLAELSMTPEVDAGGREISTRREVLGYMNGTELAVSYYAVTQEEYDQLMALYSAIDKVYRWDRNLADIVTGEAGAYFAGDRSLDETAALIQSRASLYVNEQR